MFWKRRLTGAQGEAIPVRLPVMHVRCADGAYRPSSPACGPSWRYGKAVLDGPTTEGEKLWSAGNGSGTFGATPDADDARLKI